MRVVFIGTGDIGLPVLHWLRTNPEHELAAVVTQPDKPVGREQRIESPAVKAALDGSGIPVLQPERIKRPEAIQQIQDFAPDVIIVMAYGQILPRAVLEIPQIACLNLHASILPRHRGAAPIQAAIAAGDSETGITVMYMSEGLDTGDVLSISRIPIRPDESGGSLHDRLAEIAPAALEEALILLASGKAPRIPQHDAEATYAPKLEREHGLIDWSQTADSIERKIRAFDPWPGMYTLLRDGSGVSRKLKIFHATLGRETAENPGAISVSSEGQLTIAAADGVLHLDQVQLEGKKRMAARDLLRGNAWIANATAISIQ